MLINNQPALVPYSAGSPQMATEASGYLLMNPGRTPYDMGMAYSRTMSGHDALNMGDEKHETVYSWNRRPVSFGMPHVGSFIDIYA